MTPASGQSSDASERPRPKRRLRLPAVAALILVPICWFWLRSTETDPDSESGVGLTTQSEAAPVVGSPAPSKKSEPSSRPAASQDVVSELGRGLERLEISKPLVLTRPASSEPQGSRDASGLAFSPDGKRLAWWVDGSAWQIPVTAAHVDLIEASLGAVGGVTALAWDTEGSRWLTGDDRGRLRIWGLLEQENVSDPTPEFEMRLTGLEESVSRVDWSGQLMACSAGGKIWLWQGDGRRLVATWQAHEQAISFLSFRRDGKALLSADEGGGLRLWNAAGRLLEDYSEIPLGSVQAAGFDTFGFVVAWARQGLAEPASGEGPWGLWREAGGWWFPPEPLDGSVRVALADDGSYLLWQSREAFLFKLRDEQIQPLSGIDVGMSPVLSPGGHRLAWLDEADGDDDDSVAQRALVAPLLPDPVEP